MLERMEEKGWLSHRVIGRTYFYSALVPREVSLGKRVVEMVDKACGGRPERLMTALMEYRGLTDDEVRRIREMLDRMAEHALEITAGKLTLERPVITDRLHHTEASNTGFGIREIISEISTHLSTVSRHFIIEQGTRCIQLVIDILKLGKD